MSYIILIIIFVIIAIFLSKKTFYWETIIKYLWKQIYQEADKMTYWLGKAASSEDENGVVEIYKKDIDSRGNLINSILDYINGLEKKDDNEEDVEEKTFGYSRYDFNTILMLAKSRPNAFKKIK